MYLSDHGGASNTVTERYRAYRENFLNFRNGLIGAEKSKVIRAVGPKERECISPGARRT